MRLSISTSGKKRPKVASYFDSPYFQEHNRQGKKYPSRNKDKRAGRGYIKNRVGIEERPQAVEDKSRVGDWEVDLVIGKGYSGG